MKTILIPEAWLTRLVEIQKEAEKTQRFEYLFGYIDSANYIIEKGQTLTTGSGAGTTRTSPHYYDRNDNITLCDVKTGPCKGASTD